ncbi:MAG: hypothetical protein ACK53Y_00115, partial [bacterium]
RPCRFRRARPECAVARGALDRHGTAGTLAARTGDRSARRRACPGCARTCRRAPRRQGPLDRRRADGAAVQGDGPGRAELARWGRVRRLISSVTGLR